MFGMGIDRRVLIMIFGGMAIFSLLSGGPDVILSKVFILPGIIIAITFHEFAHAFAAVRLGDDTPKQQGRLNLNPVSHVDPIGFILLLVAGFGWGRPVQIQPNNFDRKYSMGTAEAIVAMAGPLMNFILAFLFLIIYYAVFTFVDLQSFMTIDAIEIMASIMVGIVSINVALGVFNLIPLPPLDGSKILVNFLSYKGKQWFYENQQLFYIGFLVIWISGASRYIITPVVSAILSGMVWVVESFFGLF